MTIRELFEFITDPSINSDNINEYLERVGGEGGATSSSSGVQVLARGSQLVGLQAALWKE
jgi:hypothetical protein